MKYDPENEVLTIQVKDIDVVTAESVVREWVGYQIGFDADNFDLNQYKHEQMRIAFENGPELAEYDFEKLQRMLRWIENSASELEVLRDMLPYVPQRLNDVWTNCLVFCGDQGLLFDDFNLDLATVCMMSENLHDMERNGEHHCLVIVQMHDLPAELQERFSELRPEEIKEHACLVLVKESVIQISPVLQDMASATIGNINFVKMPMGTLLRKYPDILKSTRIRPEGAPR